MKARILILVAFFLVIVGLAGFFPSHAQKTPTPPPQVQTSNGGPPLSNPLDVALLKWYKANLTTTVTVGNKPYGLCYDGQNIWAVNYADFPGTVTKVRANDATVLGTFTVGHQPMGIAFDGADIWVSNTFDNTVTKLRASDGSTLGTFDAPGAWSLAFDGANIWVGSNTLNGMVVKLRVRDGKNLGTFATGGTGSVLGLAVDGENIWATNYTGAGNGTVSKLRVKDGSVVGVYTVGPNPWGIAFDGAYMWVANDGGASISKVRASDGSVVGTFNLTIGPYGVAFDGLHIWVTTAFNVTELHDSDGAVIAKYPTKNAAGIAFDGANMWVADESVNLLHKF